MQRTVGTGLTFSEISSSSSQVRLSFVYIGMFVFLSVLSKVVSLGPQESVESRGLCLRWGRMELRLWWLGYQEEMDYICCACDLKGLGILGNPWSPNLGRPLSVWGGVAEWEAGFQGTPREAPVLAVRSVGSTPSGPVRVGGQ